MQRAVKIWMCVVPDDMGPRDYSRNKTDLCKIRDALHLGCTAL